MKKNMLPLCQNVQRYKSLIDCLKSHLKRYTVDAVLHVVHQKMEADRGDMQL